MQKLLVLGLALAMTAGCGSDGDTGTGTSGQKGAGGSAPGAGGGPGGVAGSAGGVAGSTGGVAGSTGGVAGSAGGTTGVVCTSTADCPQTDCFGCPPQICVDGRCVPAPASGTGGASGDLKWFSTCGPPVCQLPDPSSGGASSAVPACTGAETAGASCAIADAECDPGEACSGPLRCTTSDPTHGGQCPKSRAKYKTDIQYLSREERAKLADDVQSIPLVRYRYKDGPERQHLGFIIEDVEPSPSVDSKHDEVDLYGYTSMAIAAVQEQRREVDALRAEVAALRAELARYRRQTH